MVKKISKLLAILMIFAVVFTNVSIVSYANGQPDDLDKYVSSYDEFDDILRENMVDRESRTEFYYKTTRVLTEDELYSIVNEITELAYDETVSSSEGDYLRWSIDKIGYGVQGFVYDTTVYYTIFYNIEYYTTKSQENELDEKVDEVIDSFNFNDSTTEKEKSDKIYRYITKNIRYDYKNLYDDSYTLKQSAYAALINKTAVCQGYATLYYKMAKECGLKVRVITGESFGENHAWNIVKIGGKYYYLDSTWDEGTKVFKYYLKGTRNFKDHESDDKFKTREFLEQYSIDVKDYDAHDFLETYKDEFRTEYTCEVCGYVNNILMVPEGETLAQGNDGKWYYLVDGVKNYSSTLIPYDGKLCYIKNGIWDKTVGNVIVNYDGKNYYINKGVWDDKYTKIIKSGGKNLYIEKGIWQNSKTGFVKYEGKYRYIKKGEWESTTTFIKDGSKYWYVKSGIRTNTTGFVNYKGDYRYIVDGVWNKTTGFVKYGSKYYYVSKGVRSDETGFVKVDGEYYMIKKGVKSSDETYIKYKNTYLKLSSEQYSYNGKNKKPSIKVYDSSAKAISSKKYTVKLPKSTSKVGKYAVSIKFKSGYSGSTKLYFTIVPKATKVSKVSASKKALKITIKKETKEVTGYQIEYATSKDFKKAKKVKITKNKTTTLNIKNLKAKTGYYVRVRTYKTVGGKTYYSEWSKAVSKKTK